jgi:hypothetical protein
VDVALFGDYYPHPKARAAFLDDAMVLLMVAGRRGAKTHTSARRMLRMIYERDLPRYISAPYKPGAVKPGTAMWWRRRPRLHYWVVAETADLLKEPQRYLLEFLPAELLEHADATSGALWLRPDILIEFKTGLLPKRLVSSGLNGVWVEEAARLSPVAWEGFLQQTLADKGGWAQFSTTPLGQDWTYSQIELPALRGELGYACHAWVTADNTKMPELQKAVEKARKLLPPTYFKREYEASRDAFEGQIYPFDEATMAFDRLPPGVQLLRRLGGQDWGFTAPGAHITTGFTSADPNRSDVWALDEVYDSSQLVEDYWVPEVRKKMARWKYNETVADPAEPDNIQRFNDAGINTYGHRNLIVASTKWDDHERSIRAGIRAIASLMHQKRFFVLKSCPNLISELKSYRWDSFKAGARHGSLIERPAPGQKDHAATAFRYGATTGLEGAVFEPFGAAHRRAA